ncbi:uncharacterized protein LOC141616903 [Silene latifolia]|uniref:uncharacterized protein LOC141616903 n=1 Tax=Silene latifolia TaxID=37657 RepID=UPI003D781CA5
MEISICSRRKLGFLTGVVKRPTNDPLKEATWDTCNCLLINWIHQNVEQSIKKSVLYTRTAYEIWEYLKKQLFVSNGARKFKLNKELDELEKGDKAICEYFTELRILWQNLEIMSGWPPVTQVTAEVNAWLDAQHKEQEERKLFQFLNSLHPSYSTMRSNVLMMSPLPRVEEAAAMFQHEEAQSKNYKSNEKWLLTTLPSLLDLDPKFPEKSQAYKLRNQGSSHSGYQGGYHGSGPKSYKPGMNKWKQGSIFKEGRMAANASVGEGQSEPEGSITLTAQQFEQLMSSQRGKASGYPEIEDELEANFAGMAYLNCSYASNTTQEWIIDSGASNHMISDLNALENIRTLNKKHKINLPNGETTTVSHIGTYIFDNGLILKNVLFVPAFKHNLLSVQKLTQDENCYVMFYAKLCVIHDFHARTIKGIGRENKGVYYLLNNDSQSHPKLASQSVKIKYPTLCNANVSVELGRDSGGIFSESCNAPDPICKGLPNINVRDSDVWHLRMGHAPDDTLKHIPNVPSHTPQNSKRLCITCSMAKQTKLPFPLKSIKPLRYLTWSMWTHGDHTEKKPEPNKNTS